MMKYYSHTLITLFLSVVCMFTHPFFSQEGFRKAMQMVGGEFLDRLEFYQSSWLPARVVVEEAVKRRHQVQAFSIRCSPFYSSGTLWTLLFGVVVLKKDISDTVNVSVNYMNNSSAPMAFSCLCAFLVWASFNNTIDICIMINIIIW